MIYRVIRLTLCKLPLASCLHYHTQHGTGEAAGLPGHCLRRLGRRRNSPQKLRGRGGDDRPDPGGGRGPQALRAGAADAGALTPSCGYFVWITAVYQALRCVVRR